jgi:hypothetical protein
MESTLRRGYSFDSDPYISHISTIINMNISRVFCYICIIQLRDARQPIPIQPSLMVALCIPWLASLATWPTARVLVNGVQLARSQWLHLARCFEKLARLGHDNIKRYWVPVGTWSIDSLHLYCSCSFLAPGHTASEYLSTRKTTTTHSIGCVRICIRSSKRLLAGFEFHVDGLLFGNTVLWTYVCPFKVPHWKSSSARRVLLLLCHFEILTQ